MTESTRDFFDTLAKVLIRCWLLGTLLLLFSFVVFMLTGEIIDDIHGRWFGVTPHELDLIIYCGMGLPDQSFRAHNAAVHRAAANDVALKTQSQAPTPSRLIRPKLRETDTSFFTANLLAGRVPGIRMELAAAAVAPLRTSRWLPNRNRNQSHGNSYELFSARHRRTAGLQWRNFH